MSEAVHHSMTRLEWAMLLALSLLWGGSFFFNGVAVRELPPLTIVALRVAIAALILNLAVALLGPPQPRSLRVWAAFLGMGLLNNAVPFGLFVWGQTQIASGLASILNATTPLFGVVIAHIATSDERITANRLAGVIIGLLGVIAMISPAVLSEIGAQGLPELACLAGAISYALAGVYGRRFKTLGVAPLHTATGQVTASSAILVPLALVADQPWTLAVPGLPTWGAILGIGALSTAVAYILYFRILASAGATNLLLVTFLIPVTALILGRLVLAEPLEGNQMFGMAMIGLGLAAIDGRLPRRALDWPSRKARSADRSPARR